MAHVLILHDVASYAAWKKIFDAAAGIRRDAGELHYTLLRDEKDANRIVHFSAWKSLASARAFFESAELVAIRKAAGVHAPEFHYLQALEQGTLETRT